MSKKTTTTSTKSKKASLKNTKIIISFHGLGSYESIKKDNAPEGLYWTYLGEGAVSLLDTRSKTVNETVFETYSDFVNYCKKNFTNSIIAT